MEETFQNILVQFQIIPGLPGRQNLGRQDASRNGLGAGIPSHLRRDPPTRKLWWTGCRFHGLPRDGGSYSWKDGLMRVGGGDTIHFLTVSGGMSLISTF